MQMQRNLQKIDNYIRSNLNRPFEWGEFDCCTFACDIVVLAGGQDFAEKVRGKYNTQVAAKRVLSKHFGSIEDAFSPLKEIDVNFAQRGDLVLFDTERGKMMAVVWGGSYYSTGDNGLMELFNVDKPIKAWCVG